MTTTNKNFPKLNNETAKLFITNYQNLCIFFGEKRVLKQAKKFKELDFSTTAYVEKNGYLDNHYKNKEYPILCDSTFLTFKEYKGEWSREVRKPAREYRIPSQYQLKEKDLIIACLIDMYPLLKDFQISAYHADNETTEVYIKCDNGKSLYCPLKAFTECNFDIIYNRHKGYHEWYYGNTQERKEKYLQAELDTLETEIAKKLKELLINRE